MERVDDLDDLNLRMRQGHVYFREAEDAFVALLERCVRSFGRKVRIFELGCASGLLTAAMLERFPDADIVANETLPELVAQARKRLAGTRAVLYTGPLSRWERPIDVLVSGGAHHHLPHDYLVHAHRLIVPGGAYVVGDEFCPEYLHGEHARRLAKSELVQLVDGFVLTSKAEVSAHGERGVIPAEALEAEKLRKRALWHWYRFVVDSAIERDFVDVAIAELKSAHDDLVTGSDDEHKYSPALFERQMEHAGFRLASRQVIGPPDDAALQSLVVYEYKR